MIEREDLPHIDFSDMSGRLLPGSRETSACPRTGSPLS